LLRGRSLRSGDRADPRHDARFRRGEAEAAAQADRRSRSERRRLVMTHRNAIALLLGVSSGDFDRTSLDAALDHVATCFDCWRVVREVASASGAVAADRLARIDASFGCERTREGIFTLAEVSPADLRSRFPEPADHVAGCRSCAELLDDLRLFSSDVA